MGERGLLKNVDGVAVTIDTCDLEKKGLFTKLNGVSVKLDTFDLEKNGLFRKVDGVAVTLVSGLFMYVTDHHSLSSASDSSGHLSVSTPLSMAVVGLMDVISFLANEAVISGSNT